MILSKDELQALESCMMLTSTSKCGLLKKSIGAPIRGSYKGSYKKSIGAPIRTPIRGSHKKSIGAPIRGTET